MAKQKMTVQQAYKSAAWTRKEGKNPAGGLNAKGRASYKAQTGGTLKPPVSAKAAAKSPKKAARRKSFCARMGGMKKRLTSDKTECYLYLADFLNPRSQKLENDYRSSNSGGVRSTVKAFMTSTVKD
jgi:hypothetical protein